jgi:hypothetical protein
MKSQSRSFSNTLCLNLKRYKLGRFEAVLLQAVLILFSKMAYLIYSSFQTTFFIPNAQVDLQCYVSKSDCVSAMLTKFRKIMFNLLLCIRAYHMYEFYFYFYF